VPAQRVEKRSHVDCRRQVALRIVENLEGVKWQRPLRPREPKGTGRAPNRYPIALQLRYRAKSELGLVQGLGQTITISNQDIVFATADKLKPSMNVEIVLDWPCIRDPRFLCN
jgi:hypothetical protein